MSLFDFSSQDDIYYNPPVGKPTSNPKHQVNIRIERKWKFQFNDINRTTC